ncbi:hypothetical protein WJX84_005433 [Apatococcus fuscideae]|uniref:Uncharacterized protein n=1 Tax=Apatococcus fuscideae TaxID=2026836 RepID=A0AAW1TK98_9CHLO
MEQHRILVEELGMLLWPWSIAFPGLKATLRPSFNRSGKSVQQQKQLRSGKFKSGWGEQDRHLRDRDSRLLALQRQHLEDDRQGYEALMQQLQQGLSALGSRLALLERTAGRDAAHASQALLYDDPRAERLLSGSSIASSQQVVNEVMRSDVVITPPGSHPSSRPSSRQESEGRHQASGDQLREPVLDAACAGYSRPSQPSSRMRPMDPERIPLNSMPDSATGVIAVDIRHAPPGHPPAASHQEATFPPRPGMDTLPEEDIQADERALLPSSNVAASPSKQQRFIKRLSKPGNSCKGCVIS